MSNASSCSVFSGPSANVGNATSETLFTNAVGGASCTITLPANGEYKNKLLRMKAAGRVTPGTTGNVTVSIYGGTTVTSGNKIGTTGTVSCASACPFIIDVVMFWNNDTDSFWGYQTGIMGATPTLTTLAINSNKYSADPDPTPSATISFVVGALFGTSNASNAAYLDEFSIDVF